MSIKCAEIYFSNTGNFTFTCILCNENFFKAICLAEHLIDSHFFSVYPDALTSPFLISDNELSTIRNLFASKKDISLEELSSDTEKEILKSIKIECETINNINDNIGNMENDILVVDEKKLPIENEVIIVEEKLVNETENSNHIINDNIINEVINNVKHNDAIKKIKSKMAEKMKFLGKGNIPNSVYWKCHICNTIIRKGSRSRHMNMHQSIKYKYYCKYCKESFSTNSKLIEHTRIHTGEPERPYKCPQCDNKYKVITHLKEHIKRAHLKIRNYKCSFCEKGFFSNEEAKRHEISWHSQPKPYICELCGVGCITTQQFKNHKRRHAAPTFECDKCDKKFHVKRSLTIHQIVHKDQKPYECTICLSRFPRYKSYTRHMILHTGVKDYICKICGKAFAQASGIGCHMKSHGIKYSASNVIRKSKTSNDNESQ